MAITHMRRGRLPCSPTHLDTPSKSGSVGAILDSRQAYKPKITKNMAESHSVRLGFNGRVSEYSVAMPRNTISTDMTGASRTSLVPVCLATGCLPALRARQTANADTNTTSGQPMPTSTRLAPVMLANASEQTLDSPVRPGPPCAQTVPHFQVNTKSTAYSGNTASSASSASARPALMSTCAASAAQDKIRAAPIMATPYMAAAITGENATPGRPT